MKNLIYWGLSLALLAGCQAKPEKAASAPTAAAGLPTPPTAAVTEAAPYTGYHRYRGTVGSQPVTVELTIEATPAAPDSMLCTGSYSYDRHPAGWLVLRGPRPWRPGQPLQLAEADPAQLRVPTGYWQATQPVGPLLAGTWRSPTGKQLPFSLREDYTDGRGHLAAVRYELLTTTLEPPCQPARLRGETPAEYRTRARNAPHGYSQQFLHLLGRDTLRPPLRAMQCPGPRQRRRQVQAAAKANGSCNYHGATLQVEYNAYGLLAVVEDWEDDSEGGARPSHGTSTVVYDLPTGQSLSLPDVLRPGVDTLLRQLITRHLLDGSTPEVDPQSGPAGELAPLPGGEDTGLALTDFSLTDSGMAFRYSFDSVTDFLEGGSLLFSVVVPYRELQPLLRPASPVARMLRERGLWRGK